MMEVDEEDMGNEPYGEKWKIYTEMLALRLSTCCAAA